MTTNKPLVSRPPRQSTKGTPPTTATDTAAVANHTQKPDTKELVDFNFKVPAEFKREFRMFCAAHGLKGVQYMMEVVEKDMKNKGWAK